MRRSLAAAIALVVLGAAGWLVWTGRLPAPAESWRPWLSTPHEAYARSLDRAGLADAPLGRAWLDAARSALAAPAAVGLPYREAVWLPAAEPRAVALRATMRRGQRLVARADVDSAAPLQLFLDVYRVTDQGLEHVASAGRDRTGVNVDIHRDAEYVVRLQPELLRDARVTILWQGEPTLSVPVEGANGSSIQSYFLAPRDGGRREHHGVDIFAPRGTPVVAAAGGLVASVADNRLGGRVVWVVRPRAGERHYYAHLDEQLVSPGTPVDAGDVLGRVGTTGNARGGPPHLHFGIYTGGGPVDPLPYLAPAAPAPAIGGEDRLGTLARLRRDKTPVRIVGALPLQLRVALPDGTERLVAATDVEATVRPLRVIRVTAPMILRSNAIDGVAMETVSPPATLRVLGTFAGATLVEQPDGRRGWIESSLNGVSGL